MPDGVDALVKQIQPAESDTTIDRVVAEAKIVELSARNHPVLPCRDLGDRSLIRPRSTFTVISAVNVDLGTHRPHFGGRDVTDLRAGVTTSSRVGGRLGTS